MRNWRKHHKGKALRSERARKAAVIRWERYHAELAAVLVRETRYVELTILDSHRPMRVIKMQAEPARSETGWGRWAVTENGTRIGTRRMGRTTLAGLIARSLA